MGTTSSIVSPAPYRSPIIWRKPEALARRYLWQPTPGDEEDETAMSQYVDDLMKDVTAKNPPQTEFHQAVREVAESVELIVDRHPVYREQKLLERLIEPERVVMFRVPWVDDRGEI